MPGKQKVKRAPDYQKERGDRQRERIMAAIRSEPKTAQQLAEVLHCSRSNVCLHLRILLDEKPRRLHVADHKRTCSRAAPMFLAGDKPDATFEKRRKPKQPDRIEARLGQLRKLLKEMPRTANELSEAMLLDTTNVTRYTRTLRDGERKEVYIKDWRHPGKRGDWAPIYALGNLPDKPKPKPTRAERYRKEKADHERHDRTLAKRRASHRVAAALKKPQNPFSALGL